MHPLFWKIWEVDASDGTKRQVTSKLAIFAVGYIMLPKFTINERSAEDEEKLFGTGMCPKSCGCGS